MKKIKQLNKIIITGVLMGCGLFLLKYLPMKIWGSNILFDASFHLTATFFVLYVLWFFVDQNKSWRVPYFIFSILTLFIVSVQRILDNAHNDIGLLLGLIISATSIYIAERKNLKGKFNF
ncbi:MAG: hypothetical protein KJZ60_03965 [Ignavibacteriaceae bacterium]|nr:hypothetical protein [Ignavibacteriaceae bacterium]